MTALRSSKIGTLLFVLAGFAPTAALAQQSASFKLESAAFNAGGHPSGGSALASPSFHINLDALGEGAVSVGLSSATFHMDGSFVSTYRPPGEVLGLRFVTKETVQWSPERAAGEYEIYRALISTLPGGFGTCFAAHLMTNTAAAASNPSSGQGYFYLVTARNRLGEEGTKGYRSNGMERPNAAPCP